MAEPLTVYGARKQPIGIEELRSLSPAAAVAVGTGGEFVVEWTGARMTITVMDADDVGEHLAGFESFARTFGASEEVVARIGGVRQIYGLQMDVGDETVTPAANLVRRLVQRVDGLIFRPPGVLFDAEGRVLLDPFELRGAAELVLDDGEHDEDPDEEDSTEPPTAERVADRAGVLCAIAARGLLEFERPHDAELQRERLCRWVHRRGLAAEVEDHEWEILDAPIGTLDEHDATDAVWRTEGLAVLLWALGLVELPPHDRPASFDSLADIVSLTEAEAPEGLACPVLRSDAALRWMGRRLLGLHWRLRDFALLRRRMDFRAFAADCWFGSFDLEGIPLVDGDLAIDDVAISEATEEAFQRSHSIAMERHQAINWLQGWHVEYSEVDTPT